MLPYGTQHLTDRELLLIGLERLEQVHEAVYGPPSLTSRLDILETERSLSAKASASLSATVSGIVSMAVVAAIDAFRKANT